MDPIRWRRINDIFQDAIARAADARQPYLADVCAGDAALREEVERLLRAHEQAAGFLARPALAHVHDDRRSLVDPVPADEPTGRDGSGRGRVSRHGSIHGPSPARVGRDGRGLRRSTTNYATTRSPSRPCCGRARPTSRVSSGNSAASPISRIRTSCVCMSWWWNRTIASSRWSS